MRIGARGFAGPVLTLLLLGAAHILMLPPAHSWGTVEHPTLARAAAQLMPEPWRDFLVFYDWLLGEGSLYPDTTYLEFDKAEQPRHYIDFEIWDPAKPETGTATAAIPEFYAKLVGALKAQDWGAALLLAGRVSHYLADLHQPYHTTKNFWPVTSDGVALHSLIDRGPRNHMKPEDIVRQARVEPIRDLPRFLNALIQDSRSYLPFLNNTLLDHGRNHTKGVDWSPELTRFIINRFNNATVAVARLWLTAVLEATVQPPTVPRNTPLRMSATALPDALDPAARTNIAIQVQDSLGVLVNADVKVIVDGITLRTFAPPGVAEPHGHVVIAILPGELAELRGKQVTLTIEASRSGYQAAVMRHDLPVSGAVPGPLASPVPDTLTIVAVAAIVVAAVAGAALLRRQRRPRL